MRRSPIRSEPTPRRWRPLVVALTTCLALVAAACGDDGDGQIPQTGNVDSGGETTESTETTETTETTLGTTTSIDGGETTTSVEPPPEGLDTTAPAEGE